MQLCCLPSSLKQRCPHSRGSCTRLNVASPASATLHSIAWIALPALGPTLVIVGQTSARFTSPSPAFGVLRRFPVRVVAGSFNAGRHSHDGILPRTCCRGSTTAERSLSCLPSSEDQGMTSPIFDVYLRLHESVTSAPAHGHMRAHHKHSCVIVTMALVPISVILKTSLC